MTVTHADPTCIFCRIAAGELPSEIVHQDDEFLAIRDIAPKADTHVLVLPRAHHAHLDAWLADAARAEPTARMLAFVRDTAAALDVAGRYRLITNVGADAGQEVPHLHWHVLAGSRLPGF